MTVELTNVIGDSTKAAFFATKVMSSRRTSAQFDGR